MSSRAFRQLLEAGDVAGLRKAWGVISPLMPQPATHEQAEIVMHRARTESRSVSFLKRAYSHAWLTERMLPSGLPDELRPRAEQVCPRIVEAVGISVNFRSSYMRPASEEVRQAMADAVEDCYAEGRTKVAFVRKQMAAAKEKTLQALFGR